MTDFMQCCNMDERIDEEMLAQAMQEGKTVQVYFCGEWLDVTTPLILKADLLFRVKAQNETDIHHSH